MTVNRLLVYPVMLLPFLVILVAGCEDTEHSAPAREAEPPAEAVIMPEQIPEDFAIFCALWDNS